MSKGTFKFVVVSGHIRLYAMKSHVVSNVPIMESSGLPGALSPPAGGRICFALVGQS